MREIITDIEALTAPAEPLKFLTDTGISKEEGDEIIKAMHEVLEANPEMVALTAPQIGYNKRIFCIRFSDVIKTFINPIIKQKKDFTIAIEQNSSFPGKEFLIARPKELTAVYYTDDYKFEDNKFLSPVAGIFDQQYAMLDGDLPNELGLMSDIAEDGSLYDLTEEEFAEAVELYKKFVQIKAKNMEEVINKDEHLQAAYKNLKFTESVVNGRAQVVENPVEPKLNREQRRAIKFKKGGKR